MNKAVNGKVCKNWNTVGGNGWDHNYCRALNVKIESGVILKTKKLSGTSAMFLSVMNIIMNQALNVRKKLTREVQMTVGQ